MNAPAIVASLRAHVDTLETENLQLRAQLADNHDRLTRIRRAVDLVAAAADEVEAFDFELADAVAALQQLVEVGK